MKIKSSVGQLQEMNLLMLTRRQIAFPIYAIFKINDAQKESIELVDDSLKKFGQAVERNHKRTFWKSFPIFSEISRLSC